MFKKLLSILIATSVIFLYCGTALAANTKSADFDTSSSKYLSRANSGLSSDLPGKGSKTTMSFSAWYKITTSELTTGTIYLGSIDDYTISSRAWHVSIVSGKIRVTFFKTNSTKTQKETTSSPFPSAGWYHIVVTYNAGDVKIYVNNSSKTLSTLATGGTFIQSTTACLTVGALSNGSGYVDGLLDEVGIYDTELSSSDVSTLYNSGDGYEMTGSETGLQAGYRFENNFEDITSNNNDLTNNNSVTYSTDVPFSGSTPTADRRVYLIS